MAYLPDVADILDHLRRPVNATERNERITGKYQSELYPYFGATGQVGYIDEYILDGNYILLGEDGAPFLDKNAYKAYIIEGKSWVNNHAHILETKLNMGYLCHALNVVDYATYVNGTTRLKLTQADMKRIVIPVPPINEQQQIVSTVETAFAVIDEIDRNKTDLRTIIAITKQKILDLAIRGKLVPQDPNDEPASVLLDRTCAERETLIKSGKLKRGKGDSAISRSDDNSHYTELPKSWAICQLGEVCEIARGGSPRPIQDYITKDSNGINWIKIGDTVHGGKYIVATQEKIRSDGLQHSRYVKVGDFLLTNSMSFGRPYILKIDGCIHDGWLVIGDVENAYIPDFLYYLLSSNWAYQSLSRVAYGSTVKNLKSDTIKAFSVPLPPLAEQQRIVVAIETAFEQLDSIAVTLT